MPRCPPPISRYLLGLATACLITLPYLGIGSLVTWLLTALTLRCVVPLSTTGSVSDDSARCGMP